MRLAFLLVSGLLFASAQIPLFLIFSAIAWDPTSVFIGELLGAIACVMIAGLAMAKEDYDGR